ncbi:RNA polymerase, sigma-24 subunit, ECF subfamily [Cystobacter fuscus DSM 2262]|uniref:RNA polymerase, sigma-24 subunit, ECF subfamily n=1 Tax=Cystobacter fuscus (strain ATCC 25194 / DSM 2262 / NBRC 100088 / M29) TaxID=1242864 RepID=S9PIG7_CYSF2|nr:RNA polymerase sigma factor [Cystobacter fuscus]EPX64100.1 RNA polymerase, sigma-24 subunit, ECF subfamily [Cystobacter fuscus DSM 2262]
MGTALSFSNALHQDYSSQSLSLARETRPPASEARRSLFPAPAEQHFQAIVRVRQAELLRLWQLHQQELLALCASLFRGSRVDAEDALSRALLTAMEKFTRYADAVQNPQAWLKRLVYNTCISILRERQRERRLMLPEAEEQTLEVPVLDTPETSSLREELGRHLEQTLHSLPERLQAAVRMRLVLGLEYAEIAARLSISESNARKRVQLGREQLRRQMARYLRSGR